MIIITTMLFDLFCCLVSLGYRLVDGENIIKKKKILLPFNTLVYCYYSRKEERERERDCNKNHP